MQWLILAFELAIGWTYVHPVYWRKANKDDLLGYNVAHPRLQYF